MFKRKNTREQISDSAYLSDLTQESVENFLDSVDKELERKAAKSSASRKTKNKRELADKAQLITCRVCGKSVSSAAASCPHCGDPYITEEKREQAELADERQREYEYIIYCDEKLHMCPVCKKKYEGELKHNRDFTNSYTVWKKACDCDPMELLDKFDQYPKVAKKQSKEVYSIYLPEEPNESLNMEDELPKEMNALELRLLKAAKDQAVFEEYSRQTSKKFESSMPIREIFELFKRAPTPSICRYNPEDAELRKRFRMWAQEQIDAKKPLVEDS